MAMAQKNNGITKVEFIEKAQTEQLLEPLTETNNLHPTIRRLKMDMMMMMILFSMRSEDRQAVVAFELIQLTFSPRMRTAYPLPCRYNRNDTTGTFSH